MSNPYRDRLLSVGVISRKSGDRVREGKDDHGRRFKAVTDELGNTVTQRHQGREEVQDVQIQAPLVKASISQSEQR